MKNKKFSKTNISLILVLSFAFLFCLLLPHNLSVYIASYNIIPMSILEKPLRIIMKITVVTVY